MIRATAVVAVLVAAALLEGALAGRAAEPRPLLARRLYQDAALTLAGAAAFGAIAGWRLRPWGLLLPLAPLAVLLGLKPEWGALAAALLWPASDARTLGVWLAAAALLWLAHGGGRWRCALLCGATAFAHAAAHGWALKDLPPAYHDEFAYRFQAEGFLRGQAVFPADGLTPSHRQMHVLTDGVYACRYFPGMALWLMPFVAAGVPWLAGWLAAAGTAGAAAALAWRWGRFPGYATGLTLAAAPGLMAFGNTMLSPTPTMFALTAFVALHRDRRWGLAGLAMGFAFLCRPLTALGVGLPFAVHALWSACRQPEDRRGVAALAAGFAAMAALLPIHNLLVTGSPWRTPYSQYGESVTPCHVYGFHNRDRGLPKRGPRTEVAYDDWAENLLPAAAPGIVGERWARLLAEGLAAPALVVLGLALGFGRRKGLLWSGALGLTLAYAPYWFAGVFGYGYLAEAMPLVVALAAVGWGRLAGGRSAAEPCPPPHPPPEAGGGLPVAPPLPGVGLQSALAALLAVRLLGSVLGAAPEVFAKGSELRTAREEHARFAAAEAAAAQQEQAPLLMLVKADAKTAVHSTLVHNSPRLDGPVVRAWHDPKTLDALLARHPGRAVYIMEHRGFAQPFGWRRLRGPQGAAP